MTSVLECEPLLLELDPDSKRQLGNRNHKVHLILSVADKYYENLNVEQCIIGFSEIDRELESEYNYKKVSKVKYNKSELFPFTVQCKFRNIDFSNYSHVNKRMGQSLDWQTGHGNMLDLIQQLLIDMQRNAFTDKKNTKSEKQQIAAYFLRFKLGKIEIT